MDSTIGLVKPLLLTVIVCEGTSRCFSANFVVSKGWRCGIPVVNVSTENLEAADALYQVSERMSFFEICLQVYLCVINLVQLES